MTTIVGILTFISRMNYSLWCSKPEVSLYLGYYPGSQAPFWGQEVTSPAIVGLNTILVRLCHPIVGLGGLLTKFFWHDG